MHPVLIEFQIMDRQILLGAYGICMIAGYTTANLLSAYIAGRNGYNRDFIYTLLLITAGTLAGAFAAGFIVYLPEKIDRALLEATHVLVGWGGIAGGMAALAAITIKWGENFLAIADICTPGYLVGIGIGRIGCHFAGCCFGIHTTSSCGVTFSDPNAIASAMQQPLIPSQLISSVFLIMSGIAFVPFVLRKKTAGICFASSAMLYSLFRFVVEFIRNDPRKFLFGFSDGQIFSAAYFALGAWILLYVIKKRRRTSV